MLSEKLVNNVFGPANNGVPIAFPIIQEVGLTFIVLNKIHLHFFNLLLETLIKFTQNVSILRYLIFF